MVRLLPLAKSALIAAALTAPAIVQANVIHCTGTDLDTYWKIEPNGSGIDARVWQSGQWSSNTCSDSAFSLSAGGYKCVISPERYVFVYWKPNGPDQYLLTERITLGRADGSYFQERWDNHKESAYSEKKEGKCALSAEPTPAKPLF